MKCPKCGSFNVQVITTKKTVEGPFETVRRRYCRSCEYRWYTAQEPEVFIGAYLQWEGDQVRVLPGFYSSETTLPAINS